MFRRGIDAWERAGWWLVKPPPGQEDLHRLLSAFVWGLFLILIGPGMLIGSFLYAAESPGWVSGLLLVFGLTLGAYFTAGGPALLLQSILPARSATARFADEFYGGLIASDGGAPACDGVQIYVLLLLVIQLLTRLLRLIGIKGERDQPSSARAASGAGTRTAPGKPRIPALPCWRPFVPPPGTPTPACPLHACSLTTCAWHAYRPRSCNRRR